MAGPGREERLGLERRDLPGGAQWVPTSASESRDQLIALRGQRLREGGVTLGERRGGEVVFHRVEKRCPPLLHACRRGCRGGVADREQLLQAGVPVLGRPLVERAVRLVVSRAVRAREL